MNNEIKDLYQEKTSLYNHYFDHICTIIYEKKKLLKILTPFKCKPITLNAEEFYYYLCVIPVNSI